LNYVFKCQKNMLVLNRYVKIFCFLFCQCVNQSFSQRKKFKKNESQAVDIMEVWHRGTNGDIR
jgi:hypothetical protein